MKPDRRFLASTALVVVAVLLLPALAGCERSATPADWKSLKAEIRKKFPEVPQMSTAELAALQEKEEPGFVLIDARAPEEFTISRIDGALNLQSVRAVKASKISPDTRIVTYCSVGYRSSALARNLQEAGFRNIANLEGSLFAWANEGRPLVTADRKPTTRVHPFSPEWAKFLDPTTVEITP